MKNKHLLIMILCCAIPILAIILLSKYFDNKNFAFLLILLCPLAHIVLMKLFMKEKIEKNNKGQNKCH